MAATLPAGRDAIAQVDRAVRRRAGDRAEPDERPLRDDQPRGGREMHAHARRDIGEHREDFGRRDRRIEPEERYEEHTSELQSLMRTPLAVFCLKKKTQIETTI